MRTRRSGAGSTISPTASTWPWTRWPPSRSDRRTGRSRLTASPGSSSPRLVRRSVSSTASAAHQPAPTSTTVRQQPLTAIESPILASSMTSEASKTNRGPARLRSRPSSSMIPVNMVAPLCRELDAQVGAEPLDRQDPASPHVADRGGTSAAEQAGAVVATGEGGRQVHDIAVDQARPVKAGGDAGTTLDQQLQHATAAEVVQDVAEVT